MKFQIMLSIIYMLSANKKITLKQICSRYDITKRTALRYVNAISMAGIPVIAELGRNGGYYLPEDFKLPYGFFTEKELEFLVKTLSEKKSASSNADDKELCLSLIEKLNACFIPKNKN